MGLAEFDLTGNEQLIYAKIVQNLSKDYFSKYTYSMINKRILKDTNLRRDSPPPPSLLLCTEWQDFQNVAICINMIHQIQAANLCSKQNSPTIKPK